MAQHNLGRVRLEHQAELLFLLERLDLFVNDLPQFGIGDFGDLVFEAGHDGCRLLALRATGTKSI
jgi:hypothetical protein